MGGSAEVRARFRCVGRTVDPGKISALLGMEPSTSHTRGDPFPRRPHHKRPYGYWGIESPLPREASLDDHLGYLLDILEPVASRIAEIDFGDFTMGFFCGFFTSGSALGTALELSIETLDRMGRLGIPLNVDVWCDWEGDEEFSGVVSSFLRATDTSSA